LTEADYVVENKKMLEGLRDIYDETDVPLFLIGMDGIQKRVQRFRQFSRRISQEVLFLPIEMKDMELLAQTVCTVKCDHDLLEQLLVVSKGRISYCSTGLLRVEAFAKKNGWEEISLKRVGAKRILLWAGR
jgi:DNA transposition AAA+ family ATPase